MNRWEIILGIVFGLLVNEVTDISPWLAQKLTRWAAHRWTGDPEIAAGYEEEWAALIDDRPGKLLKLLTAMQFTIGAAGRAAPRATTQAIRAIYSRMMRVRSTTEADLPGSAMLHFDNEKVEWTLVVPDRPEAPDVPDFRLNGIVVDAKWHKRHVLLVPDDKKRLRPRRFLRRPDDL